MISSGINELFRTPSELLLLAVAMKRKKRLQKYYVLAVIYSMISHNKLLCFKENIVILSNKCKNLLEIWLNSETWFSGHDDDMKKFYGFVEQYILDHGCSLDEGSLREIISHHIKIEEENDLYKAVLEHVFLMSSILDFMKYTNRS
jgi:hypothetical protein